MKFATATMIVLCLLASTSWSASNPLIRNCNLAGGEFTVITLPDDQWALCKIGHAYVGAIDVMGFNTQTAEPTAFLEYAEEHTECHGALTTATILNTTTKIELCRYADNSFIDTQTLNSGVQSSDNEVFNKYLGL
ncbi:hypothetical protein CIK05_05740 [Bdellovibrio sp. qaytius]|nr:hypothetical protein CIK05_05740 [Bdellovibrio sp. qaytius]